jgi:hypothetical protein
MLGRAVTTVMLVQEVRLYRLELGVGSGLDGGGRVERPVGVLGGLICYRRRPIARIGGMAFEGRMGDSSTTSCSTIEAQKDVERKWERKGLIYT